MVDNPQLIIQLQKMQNHISWDLQFMPGVHFSKGSWVDNSNHLQFFRCDYHSNDRLESRIGICHDSSSLRKFKPCGLLLYLVDRRIDLSRNQSKMLSELSPTFPRYENIYLQHNMLCYLKIIHVVHNSLNKKCPCLTNTCVDSNTSTTNEYKI